MPKYRARLRYVVEVDAQLDAPDWQAAHELAQDLRLADLVTPRVGVEIRSERQFTRVVEPIRARCARCGSRWHTDCTDPDYRAPPGKRA